MEERDAEGSDDMFDELVSCVIILLNFTGHVLKYK